MADAVHLQKLRELSAEEWNAWRASTSIKPDLRDAVLSDPNPGWAMHGVVPARDLTGYDFSDADLRGATLNHAKLPFANLRRANLRAANLRCANLRGADLTEARLNHANLTLANCHGANFSRCLFWETVFARTNLNETIGLETARHGGPSIIDHRTFKRSGRLPSTFLRGVGVPNELTALIEQYVHHDFQVTSCFISYSTRDSPFATTLHDHLERNGVERWLAEHDLRPGELLAEQLAMEVDSHERVLLILSEDSIRSAWVRFEIQRARDRERQSGAIILFPVSIMAFDKLRAWSAIDSDTGEDLARIVRAFYVQDFTGWKDPQKFAQSVDKLVRGLRKKSAEISARDAD